MSNYLGFMPAKEQPYYFISYNSEDVEMLKSILCELNNRIPLWYDYGLTYGDEWNQEIADRIQNAKAVFFFLSRGVFEKGTRSYVYKEYEMARDFFQKPSYVFLLEPIENKDVPNALLSWWIDIRHCQCVQCWEYEDIKSLLSEIERVIGKAEKICITIKTKDNICYELAPGEHYVGRGPSCKVFIPSKNVSKLHCAFSVTEEGKVTLLDLGPMNGTFVNGKLMERKSSIQLRNGDIIRLGGDVELQIEIRKGEAET